jgi:hypothetical protein
MRIVLGCQIGQKPLLFRSERNVRKCSANYTVTTLDYKPWHEPEGMAAMIASRTVVAFPKFSNAL